MELVIYREIDVNRLCPSKGEKADLNTQASSVFSSLPININSKQ